MKRRSRIAVRVWESTTRGWVIFVPPLVPINPNPRPGELMTYIVQRLPEVVRMKRRVTRCNTVKP